MSHDAPGPRPRQVTVGGWVVAVASALLVVTVFDATTHLHSVETRDAVTDALTSGSARGLGLGVDDALAAIRWVLLVVGVAAAVTGVLGVFVLQRHVAARIVLTVAAAPITLSAPVGASSETGWALPLFFLGLVVAAGAGLLWTEPARDWFAGRTPATAPALVRASWPPPARREQPPAQALPPPPTVRRVEQRPVTPPRVPVEVRVACILTWAFSALTAAAYVVIIAAFAVDRAGTVDLARDSAGISDVSLSDSELVGVVLATRALFLVWCVLASLLAALCWRRHGWAWIALVVSCGMATVVAMAAVPYSVLHVAASFAAFVLLLRTSTRGWFRGSTSPVG
jgi:hypothetical protein